MTDFEEYVAARGPALLSLAVLAAGDEAQGRGRLARVLARALPRWERLVREEDPDAVLRRDLVAALGRPRLRWPRAAPAAQWRPAPEHERVWRAWLDLPPRTRALLSLRFAEQRSWVELSWLTDLPVKVVRHRVAHGLRRLGPEDVVVEALQHRVASIDTWPVELTRQAEWASRSRRERQVRGRVAAGLAVAVGLPVLVALGPSLPGDLGGVDVAPGPDGLRATVLPAGWRAESWRGVEVGVPGDWGYVSLSTWCSVDDAATHPLVERPGRYPDLDCRPPMGPGLHFRTVADPAPPVEPGLVAEERRLGNVVVLVATDEEELTEQVLATARSVERLDAAGCEVQRLVPRAGRTFPPADPGTGAVSVCRYAVGIPGANLVQSERLSVLDSQEALRAIDEAPTVVASQACLAGPGEEAILIAGETGDVAWLHLGRCQGMDDAGTHLLTEEVLRWALSPGWNGDRRDLPMPQRLRTVGPT